MDAPSQYRPFPFHAAEGLLPVAGEASGTGQGKKHGENLHKYPVPLINTNVLLADRYFNRDLLEAVLPVWGQRQRHVERVYYPPQE